MNTSLPHHRKLPPHWALIAGSNPPDDFGFRSERLQIIYNHTDEPWTDASPHAHAASEEVYIVVKGVMTVDVEGVNVDVREGEVLCVPAGAVHQLVQVSTPLESFVVRAPSLQDKVIQATSGGLKTALSVSEDARIVRLRSN